MPAPAGNKFWLARTKHGRDKLFQTPEILWEACCEYFEWVEENPLWEIKPFAYQGLVTQESVPKMRPMTIGGLCLFLGITPTTWYEYKANKDYTDIISQCETTIYQQKFAGAATDLFNANIISRDLGLMDKKEVDHKSSDGSMKSIDYSKLSKAALKEILAASNEDTES